MCFASSWFLWRTFFLFLFFKQQKIWFLNVSAYHDIKYSWYKNWKGKNGTDVVWFTVFIKNSLYYKKLCHSAQGPSEVYRMNGSDCNLSEIIQPAVHESGAKSYTARSSPLSFFKSDYVCWKQTSILTIVFTRCPTFHTLQCTSCYCKPLKCNDMKMFTWLHTSEQITTMKSKTMGLFPVDVQCSGDGRLGGCVADNPLGLISLLVHFPFLFICHAWTQPLTSANVLEPMKYS